MNKKYKLKKNWHKTLIGINVTISGLRGESYNSWATDHNLTMKLAEELPGVVYIERKNKKCHEETGSPDTETGWGVYEETNQFESCIAPTLAEAICIVWVMWRVNS